QIIDNVGGFYVQAVDDALTTAQSTPLQLTRSGDGYIGRDIYEKGRTTPVGHWINVPADSSYFAMGGPANGNWAITTVGGFAYTLIGNTMTVAVQVTAGQWYITSNMLNVFLPGSKTAQRPHIGTAWVSSGTMGYELCAAFVGTGATWV